MADFRKYALAFAGVACFLGITSTASAQFIGFSCVANAATPLQMRAEGITEQAGDAILSCTGGTPTAAGTQVPQVNITLALNTQVTSRLIGGSSINNLTDALLLVNDPQPGAQVVCSATAPTFTCGTPLTGTGAGGAAGKGQYVTQNVYNGILTGANQLTFFGVPIDPPGPAANGTLTVRITNIRANASALGAPSGFSSTSVTSFISTSAGLQISNPTLTIGSVFQGLLQGIVSGGVVTTPVVSGVSSTSNTTTGLNGPSTGGAPTLTQCTSNSLSSSNSSAALVEYVNFTEGFATATKLRVALAGLAAEGFPGAFLNAESQFILNGTSTTYGYADFGTRIKLVFGNLPTGVTVYVPTTVNSNQSTTASVTEALTLTSSETGAFAPVTPATTTGLPSGWYGGFAPLTIASGGATAVYEASTQATISSSIIESFSVPILVTYTASPSTGSPGLGTSTVQISFAPVSTVTTASAGPIPRFITSTPVNNSFSINTCATVLLFPFVTNEAGFDTGLAIASTSLDPFGTAVQGGTCTLNFYGTAAPAAFVTPNIAGGTAYATLTSTVAAGFQGYVIAQCKFQYAHGFAFVTDGFGGPGRGLSQGYLSLIIPDVSITSRKPNFNASVTGGGEGLPN